LTDNEQFWRAIVTGDAGVMRRERRRHRRIPGAPRCKTCLVPLGGPAAPVVRLVLKRRPSTKNPNYCDVCETFVRTHPGGAEVEISMLFADVRGSTTLAEHMRPTEFSSPMNRFFDRANRVVIDVRGEFSDEYFAQAATNRPVSGCRPRTTAPATTRCSPTGPGQSAAIAPTSPRWRRQRAS